jgi:hypothetical protein
MADLSINPGLEMVNCFNKYFDLHETKLHDLIDNMTTANIEIEIISDVMNKLSHAKRSKKEADFSQDEKMKSYIAHIHKNNPTIFDSLVKGIPDHLPHDESPSASVEKHLSKSLAGIHMSEIKIDVLNEEMIDAITQGLDSQMKRHSADLNETMMYINEKYDSRSQMVENARQIVKQAGDLSESINRKMGK